MSFPSKLKVGSESSTLEGASRSVVSGKRGGSSAFSLLELIVIIAIIAVLVILIFPAVIGMQESGKASKCASNQRNILSALMAYTADHNNELPCYGDFSGIQKPWWEQLSPYLGGSDENPAYAGINMLRCPSQKDATRFATYGVNYGYSTYAPFSYTGIAPTYTGSMRLSIISANTYLIADCLDPSQGGGNAAIYSPLVQGGWIFDSDRDGDGIVDSCSSFNAKFNQFDPRHRKMANCGFADGSVRAVSVKQWQENSGDLWGSFRR